MKKRRSGEYFHPIDVHRSGRIIVISRVAGETFTHDFGSAAVADLVVRCLRADFEGRDVPACHAGLQAAVNRVTARLEAGHLPPGVKLGCREMPLKTIVVTVEGGVVQAVSGIPAGWQVLVRDYDVDGVEPRDLNTDRNGHRYVLMRWEAKQIAAAS